MDSLFLLWPILIILLFWSIFWKGFALWRAARRGDRAWFIALLIINTVGILEIIYLFFIIPKENAPSAKTPAPQT